MPVLPLLRHATRRLRRAPAFTLAAVLTLAIGIGGTIAVFTVIDGVLIRPLPYARAAQLVDLSHTLAVSGIMHVDQSDATYLLYRRDNRVFTDVGAYAVTAVNLRPSSASASDAAQPERVTAAVATGSLFHVLETPALRGRALSDADDAPGAAPVAVIDEGLWRRDFNADPAIVGRRITVDGREREIVGVMPADFRFPAAQTALWLPLTIDPARTKSAAFDYRGVARLRPGVTIGAATADLQRLLPQVPVAFPGRLTAPAIAATHMQAVVTPLRDVIIGNVARVLWIVLGAVAALLLVACSNVANLFLARAEGRQRELAVRRALGAGRGVVLAEFLSEAAVLSVAGGVLGLVCANAGIRLLQSMNAGSTIPRLAEVHVDGVVVAVTVATTVLTALLVSALPLLRSRSVSLSAVLAAHSLSSSGGRARHGARRALVVSQVALALMLLASAGLFARSFAHLQAVNPGFDADHALSFRLALPGAAYPAASDVANVVTNTLNALRALPDVRAVGVATKLPLDDEARQDSAVFIEDRPLRMGQVPDVHEITFATPGYFQAMGIPLIAGHTFTRLDPGLDTVHAAREAIVSEAFAKRYWKNGNPLGKRLFTSASASGPAWLTIVGVVGSVRDAGLEQPPVDAVYLPLVTTSAAGAPWAPRDLAFVVRTSGDADALGAAVRTAVHSAAPTLPLYHVRPLRELMSDAAARTTFTLFLLGIAAIVATIVGAMGIYGVIAYLVSLRQREIGVRIALGAPPAAVRRLVVRHALTDAVAGIVIGLAGVLLFARLLTSALFGVRPTDPVALGGAAVVLLATAIVASWVPARRAARVDPVVALRAE